MIFGLFLAGISSFITKSFDYPIEKVKIQRSPLILLALDEKNRLFLEFLTKDEEKDAIFINYAEKKEEILDFYFLENTHSILILSNENLVIFDYEKDEVLWKLEENCSIKAINYEENLNDKCFYLCLGKTGLFLKEIDLLKPTKGTILLEITEKYREIVQKDPVFREKGLFFDNNSMVLDVFSGSYYKNNKENQRKVAFSRENRKLTIEHWKITLFLPDFLDNFNLIEIIPLRKSEFLFNFQEISSKNNEILIFSTEKNEISHVETTKDLFSIYFSEEILILFRKTGFSQYFLNENLMGITPFSTLFEKAQNLLKFKPFNEKWMIIGFETNQIKVWDFWNKKIRANIGFSIENQQISNVFPLKNLSLLIISSENRSFLLKSVFKEEKFIEIPLSLEINQFFELSESFQLIFTKKSCYLMKFLNEKTWSFDFPGEIVGFSEYNITSELRILLVITRNNRIFGFYINNNMEIWLFLEEMIISESSVYKLINGKGVNKGISAYVSMENKEMFKISYENQAFHQEKIGKLPGRLEESFIFDEEENFLVFQEENSNKKLLFLNKELISDFSIPVLAFKEVIVVNEKRIIFHDYLKMVQLAKFYRCEGEACYCSNGEKVIDGNCEKIREIEKKTDNKHEFTKAWPYMLIIGVTMGVMFVWIIYNIKSTEKELMKNFKQE